MTTIARRLTIGFSVIMLAIVAAPVVSVSARGEVEQQPIDDKRTARTTTTSDDSPETPDDKRTATKERVAQKLDDTKQKVCKNREAGIKKNTNNIQERASRQLDVFGKIVDRVKQFYVDKQYSVANYDELVQAVDDKRAAAEMMVKDVTTFSQTFSCTSDNAGTFKDELKAQLRAQQTALKDYKTAVKNLIVAVKSANSESKTTESESTGGQR
ncbi:MAG: hypothetical protein WBB39_03440 [Candidatus Saccharimonadales bacterium]